MKKKIVLLSLIGLISLTGCQATTRSLGGNMTLKLEPNQKLELITWKDDELWYLTRPMREEEEAEVWTYQESSEWHVMEGIVTIVETKK